MNQEVTMMTILHQLSDRACPITDTALSMLFNITVPSPNSCHIDVDFYPLYEILLIAGSCFVAVRIKYMIITKLLTIRDETLSALKIIGRYIWGVGTCHTLKTRATTMNARGTINSREKEL